MAEIDIFRVIAPYVGARTRHYALSPAHPHRLFRESPEPISEYHRRLAALFERSAFGNANYLAEIVKGTVDAAVKMVTRRPSETIIDTWGTVLVQLLLDNKLSFRLPEFDEKLARNNNYALPLRRDLEEIEPLLLHEEHILDTFIADGANMFISSVDRFLPGMAFEAGPDTNFTVPLLDLLKNPAEFVQGIIATFFDQRQANTTEPFARAFWHTRHQLFENLLAASGISFEKLNADPHRLTLPEHSGLEREKLVQAYLAGTPFVNFLHCKIPFAIPRAVYSEHALVCAPSGGGKTQYLQSIVLDFLNEADPPSMFILDSQDDDNGILAKIAHLDVFHPEHGRLKDRLLILSPEDKPALNLFRITAEESEAESLFLYLTAAIDRELTAKMATAATYILRLLREIPNATILTFLKILEEPQKFSAEIARLDDMSQSFFANQFNVKTEMGATRLQVASRLYTILGKTVFREMFSSPTNCFDAFEAMQQKKIVLVNTSERKLGTSGSALFGRFVVAQCMAGALRRGAAKRHDLSLLILDEAHAYYDDQTDRILRTARKFNLGLISATQMYDAIDPKVKAALATNTSTKLAGAVSDKDAGDLAREMRTSKEAILACDKGEFQTYVRGLTPAAIKLKVSFGALESALRMSENAYRRLRASNLAAVAGQIDAPVPNERESGTPTLHPKRPAPRWPTTEAAESSPLLKPGKEW